MKPKPPELKVEVLQLDADDKFYDGTYDAFYFVGINGGSLDPERMAEVIAEADQLERDLQNAGDLYSSSVEKGLPNPRRSVAARVLKAFADYSKALRIERRWWAPLLDLMGALADAERGLENPLTKPDDFVQGSSTAKTKNSLDTACAAAAVTALQRIQKKGAYAKVAEATGISIDELRTDLKDIRAGRAPEPVIEHYHLLLAILDRYVGLPLVEQNEAILKVLKNDRMV